MYAYITNISARGIKNLKDEISLTFYDKTIKPKINLSKTNIKVIYGANGSGKSAIIHAMDIYENIITENGFLYVPENTRELDELLNKESENFEIKVTFLVYDENGKFKGRFRHELIIGKMNDEFIIVSEKLIQIKTRTEDVFVEIYNGEFIKKNITKYLEEKSINQLTKRSIVQIFTECVMSTKVNGNNILDDEDMLILPFFLMSKSIIVKGLEADNHDFYIYHKWLRTDLPIRRVDRKIFQNSKHSFRFDRSELKDFEEYIIKLTQFIKIFKNDLISIELEKKYNRDLIIAEPHLNYGKYMIHLEFESAGVKKLVELFSLFRAKEQGAIVFIDELDSSINDIYLIKLIEYFNQNPTGQLVFTAHNVSPMRPLSKNKHSIDFITEKGQIVEWKRDGNYTPDKIYQNGLIKGLPFNIDSFDFIGVFSEVD